MFYLDDITKSAIDIVCSIIANPNVKPMFIKDSHGNLILQFKTDNKDSRESNIADLINKVKKGILAG